MPLYDNDNPLGDEAPTLMDLADLLAEQPGAHSLVGATGTDEQKKVETLAHILIGTHPGAWDNDQFGIAELEARGCEFQLMALPENGKVVSVAGFDVEAQGQFIIQARRQCKAGELADRSDLYLFMLDRCSAIENGLGAWFETRNCPRLINLSRLQGPVYGPRNVAQGEYQHVTWSITWGDPIGNE